MALKPDTQGFKGYNTRFYMNEVATPGSVVCIGTAGSGVAQDASDNLAVVSPSTSGKAPLGVLRTEVVNIDETKFHVNYHKNQVNLGGKVTIINAGEITTDQITGTPAAGDVAVLANSGTIGTATDASAAQPLVGRFLTSKDEDGFATVLLNLA